MISMLLLLTSRAPICPSPPKLNVSFCLEHHCNLCASADEKILTIITLNNVWKSLYFTSLEANKSVTGKIFYFFLSGVKPYFPDAYINVSLKNYFIQLLESSFNTLISKEIRPEFWLPVWVNNFAPRKAISPEITSICRGSAAVVCKSYQWIWSIGW